MTSLFNPFDYQQFLFPSLFFPILVLSLLLPCYEASSIKSLFSKSTSNLNSFFLTLKPQFFNKSSLLIFITIFFMLLIFNFASVFSFNFPGSSQVSMVLVFSLGIWVLLVAFSLVNNLKGFISHLIPEGTPLPLTLFLFLIETISSVIRPLTLTVRLVANILAGHLLMILLSSLVSAFYPAFILYLGLNLVELFVGLIQAYIFSTMIVLYFSEV